MKSTRLPPRQALFVAAYLTGVCGAEAAVRAGYARSGAKVQAVRLLKNPQVAAAVRTGQSEAAEKHEVDRDRVLSGLLEAVDLARAQGDPGAMIRAWTEIGRLCGLYAAEKTAKVDVSVSARRVIDKLETLPDSALLKMVEAGG